MTTFAFIAEGAMFISPFILNCPSLLNSEGKFLSNKLGKMFFSSVYVAVRSFKSPLKVKPLSVFTAFLNPKSPSNLIPVFVESFKLSSLKLFNGPCILPEK